ncbi:MAG: PAS domain S-box protein [bacterium]
METKTLDTSVEMKLDQDVAALEAVEFIADKTEQKYKKLLKALNDRSETYKQICNNSVNPIMIINPDSTKIEWGNKRAIDFYSLTLEELAGKLLRDIEPNFANGLLLKPGLMLKSGSTSVSMFIKQKDGSSRHVEVMFTPLIVNFKNYLCLEYNDISKWEKTVKRIENDANTDAEQLKIQLMEEKAKLNDREKRIKESSVNREILENSEDHFMYHLKKQHDNKFLLNYTSSSFKSMTGFDLNQVNSLGGWLELIVPTDLSLYNNLLNKLDKSKTASGTYRILNNENNIIWFKDTVMPEYDSSGTAIIGYMGIVSNVTRQKELEEKLRELKASVKNFRMVPLEKQINTAKEVKNEYKDILLNIYKIHVHYSNGMIIEVNEEFEKKLGYAKEKILRHTVTEIIDPGSYSEYIKNVGRTTKVPFEIIVRCEWGEKQKFHALNVPNEVGDYLLLRIAD